jgi:hypothetical protein
MNVMTTHPDRSEAAEYYFKYIDKVSTGDIGESLAVQGEQTAGFLAKLSEEQSRHRYAPGKWSVKEVVGHLNDTERLFTFRALWFARGLEAPLPSFDQDVAVRHGEADRLPWDSHVQEFRAVRAASVAFFRHLPAEAWSRRGVASDVAFSVRALAYIVAGHTAHHLDILNERYLNNR